MHNLFSPELALIALASFFVGSSKGGLPAISLLAVPLLSQIMPAALAAGLLLPVYLVSDAYGLVLYRRQFSKTNLMRLLPPAIIGIVFAFIGINWMSETQSKLLVGMVGLLYLALDRIGWQTAPAKPDWRYAAFWGSIAGFTSYIAHAGGPPFQAYILPQSPKKLIYAGTATIAFAVINFVKLPFYLAADQIRLDFGRELALSIPFALLGVWIGYQMVKILNERIFFVIVKVALLILSLKLIWDGLL